MQADTLIERYPLFQAASSETVDWLMSVATHHDYPTGRAVVMEDAWGNAVYFIEAGWVKVRRHAENSSITLAVLSRGDFFGEMAILDESPRSTDVVAMTDVKLMSISAQRFIQTLFKDYQLHHRLLQIMVQRLRQTNLRFQVRHQPPAVKLANTLTAIQEAYGDSVDNGVELFNIPRKDLADLADITPDEAEKIMTKLIEKDWIVEDLARSLLLLKNTRQLSHLAGRL
ncbi:Crp/Fnr family transcriptional regulator [Nodosilinea sp. LEGE 07088]|uniref:Crp/Fnr family transcriptional regulator n=1 Tax=Nodosilinea sp. LEGE 07088 TaxID=2777968 RepID=UPI001881B028|nr:Crp/Fnr family transcriptional regulator [Nodosilinea sp. LEGE 07088]MBE9136582.1 Crp/Fnr family transcriptional regulator [Nodosilinea sp. LEGE 07088]